MQIEIIHPRTLTPSQLGAWSAFQRASLDLQSPYFCAEFTQILARVRDDARIAVIEENGAPVGFFPHHRKAFGVGAPIGGPISDYQGVIAQPGWTISPENLLRGCKLDAFDFNHALFSQQTFSGASFVRSTSPALDLRRGFTHYRNETLTKTSELKNAERKARKIEREVGALRFVPHDQNPEAWSQFIAWKKSAYEALGVRSSLDEGWTGRALELIRDARTDGFSGMFSCLYAGEKLIAAHFGMKTLTIWHWWFPTYSPEFEKYSPGLTLLLEMARWGADQGVQRIDLGRGDARYKDSFSNTATALCEGSIEIGASAAGALRRLRKFCHHAALPIAPPSFVTFQRRAFNRVLGAGRLP